MTAMLQIVSDLEPNWLPLLPVDVLQASGCPTTTQYASWYAGLLLSAFATDRNDPAYFEDLRRITGIIDDAYASFGSDIDMGTHFLHFPVPGVMPIVVQTTIFPMAGETKQMLSRYVGAEHGAEAMVVETESMGTGLRAVVPVGEGQDREALTAVATYAFRVPEAGRDVRIQAVSSDFGLLFGALGEIEAFLRCLALR